MLVHLRAYCLLVAGVTALALLLLSCATPLVNSNLLDVAETVDDLATRQVVFNLARTKQSKFALPAQVQILSGQVGASSSVSPGISGPLSASLLSSIGQGGGAPTSTSHSINVPNVGAALGATAGTQDSYSINFVQEPEQLRRLRLLYQYGAHEISAKDLLCQYPVPEISQSQQPNRPERRYVRVAGNQINPCRPPDVVLVDNPDPAFLSFPGCVLCAFPNKGFSDSFSEKIDKHKIYKTDFSPEIEDYNKGFEYIPVVLNNRLLPNSALPRAPGDQWGKIDWLSVVRDGESVPDNARRIGRSSGYTIYVHPLSVQPVYGYPSYGQEGPFTGDEHFSEYVLSIIEATLQPKQLDKVGPTPLPLTQSLPNSP
jgi:hypothetical protein